MSRKQKSRSSERQITVVDRLLMTSMFKDTKVLSFEMEQIRHHVKNHQQSIFFWKIVWLIDIPIDDSTHYFFLSGRAR